MTNFGFIIDNRRCIGCHACTVACKSEHDVPIGVNRTWVKYIEQGAFPHSQRLFSVMRCNHCDNAPCVEICPTAALFRRRDGIVDFDSRRCIGCKACMQACPYDALYIDPNTHTAAKCNYCAHRIDQGLEPACVNVCPTQAIISGDLNDPNSTISQLKSQHQVTARRIEKGTQPALFYIDADDHSLDPLATPAVEQSMWGHQEGGVGHYATQADSGHDVLQRLADVLSFGEGSVKLSENVAAREILQAISAAPRRVYDAPQKGILWGWQVSGYLWTKSIAAGVIMALMLAKLISANLVSDRLEMFGCVTSLFFLGLTGGLLIGDLDRPTRFLYVLLRPQWRSWLVRGAYIITVYAALVTLNVLLAGLWPDSRWREGLVFPLLLAGLLTAVYTAFLFAQAKGREFWRSRTVPLHMVTHAFICGGAMLALWAPLWQPVFAEFLKSLLIITATIHALVTLIELYWPHQDAESSRVIESILKGNYRHLFWWVAIGVGVIAPVSLLVIGGGWWLPASSLFFLFGVFASQHIWVRAPQQVPLS